MNSCFSSQIKPSGHCSPRGLWNEKWNGMEQRERESESTINQAVATAAVIVILQWFGITNSPGIDSARKGPRVFAAVCLIEFFANLSRTVRIVTARKAAWFQAIIAARKRFVFQTSTVCHHNDQDQPKHTTMWRTVNNWWVKCLILLVGRLKVPVGP
jgi:hypothetical protein